MANRGSEDRLVLALREVLREDRDDDATEDDVTFRAVVQTGLRDTERRLSKVESRQDAILLLITGALVTQLLIPIVMGGAG